MKVIWSLESIRATITDNQANFGLQDPSGLSAVKTNEVQGGVGVVLLALTLLYLLSVILVIGAEINDVIARRSGVVSGVMPVTQRARAVRDRYRRRP